MFDKENFDREKHHEFSEKYEVHSEQNCILYAARNNMSVEGATLYCTLQPCLQCIKNICQSGLNRIVFRDEYDITTYTSETFEMLRTVGITIERIGE